MKKFLFFLLFLFIFTPKVSSAASLEVSTDPAGGIFSYIKVVSLSCNQECTIYYTLDGQTPTLSSSVYQAPLVILASTSLKFFATDSFSNQTAIETENYYLTRLIVSPAQNAPAQIREFDIFGREEKRGLNNAVFAFDGPGFRGGANIASGDVDGDGQDEIIIGSGAGMSASVEIYDVYGYKDEIDFSPYHSDYKGGVDVASGDVDGDGVDEIIMVNTSITEEDRDVSRVKVYKFDSEKTLIKEFVAFGKAVAGGRVSVGDVNGDGKQEIIVSANRHGGPVVRAFDINGKPIYKNVFFAFHPDYRGGIDVAAGDVDADGVDEIAVAPLEAETPIIKIYKMGEEEELIKEFLAFKSIKSGVNLELKDIDKDGKVEILAGAQSAVSSFVRAYRADGRRISSLIFYGFNKDYRIGAAVTALDF